MDLKQYIKNVENWPIDKVTFRDIAPLLGDHQAFNYALKKMHLDVQPDYWVGIESRGFVFAAAMAQKFGGGMLMLRRAGKLPPPVIKKTFPLQYGQDALEIKEGTGKVVIVDDILATGGTMLASYELCVEAGYEVLGASVLLDLTELHDSDFKVGEHTVHSVLQY